MRNIGVCNETPWGLMRYLALSQGGLPRVATIQNGYSLLDRRFEQGGLAEVAMREQVGLLAYSPLAAGQLTGKHLQADGAPDGRMSFPGMARRYGRPAVARAVAGYLDIARRHGLEPAAMALAFVRQQPFVTAVLMAASSVAQLKSNLASLQVTLPREVIKEINAVHDENPSPVR